MKRKHPFWLTSALVVSAGLTVNASHAAPSKTPGAGAKQATSRITAKDVKETVNPPVVANANGAKIEYSIPKAGRVSLAVYDANGKMVRTLASASPQNAGENSIMWDGLDRGGKAVAPGEYSWKLLNSQGMKAEYMMALGTSFGTNHWVGQHGGPTTVAVKGNGDFVVAGMPEGSPLMACWNPQTDKQRWLAPAWYAPEGGVDTAVLGDEVHSLQSNGMVRVVGAETGALSGAYRPAIAGTALDVIAPTTEKTKDIEIAVPKGLFGIEITVAAGASATAQAPARLNVTIHAPDGDRTYAFDQLKTGETRGRFLPEVYNNIYPISGGGGKMRLSFDFQAPAPDMTWSVPQWKILAMSTTLNGLQQGKNSALLASLPAANAVGWIDATRAVKETVSVPNPQDAALLDMQSALVISENRVLLVQRDGTIKPVIENLEAPHRLSIEHKTGEIFVVEGGASQQIKRFSKTYQLEKTFGRKGGRLEGLYDPQDFLNVADIAVTSDGGFLISEADSAPRRTAHFDGNGKLLKEWYGGQQFYTFAAVNPNQPNRVWLDSHWGWVMECEVDWQKRDWKVRACYRWGGDSDPLLFGRFKMAQPHFVRTLDLNHDGKKETYLISGNISGALFMVDETAGRLRPVALMSEVGIDNYWGWGNVPAERQPKAWVEAMQKAGGNPNDAESRRSLRGFSWADANGDYDFQAGEMKVRREGGGSPLLLDNDLNLYVANNWGSDPKKPAWLKYPAQSFTPTGAPIWDWAATEAGPPAGFSTTVDLRKDAAGDVYTLHQGGTGDGFVAGGTYDTLAHGWQWPANQIDSCGVVKWNSKGEKLWQVGAHAAQRGGLAGRLHFPVHFAGIANKTVGVCDKIVQPVEFWTEDGLYAGGLFDRHADDGLPPRVYSWWNGGTDDFDPISGRALLQYDMALGGSLLKLGNGDVIFIGSGWNNCPAYRVTGWDEFQRQSGKIIVKAPAKAALQNGEGLRGEYFVNANLEGDAALVQTEPRIWFDAAKKNNGVSFTWPEAATKLNALSARWTGFLEPEYSEKYTLALYGRYGAAKLWLGGQLVAQTAPITNQGGDWKVFSLPLALRAGQKYALRIERTGAPDSAFHLSWESRSQAITHIPMSALYPRASELLSVVTLQPSTPRAMRPRKNEKPARAEWVLSRSAAIDKPLDVELQWQGTAQAGSDYAALPKKIHFDAGETEAHLPLKSLPSTQAAAASVELTGQPRLSPYYLLDGTSGRATMFLSDPDCKRLEVAAVTGEGARMVDWMAPNIHLDTMKNLVNGSGLDRSVDPPLHDTNINNAWYGEVTDPDKSFLVFDLGALYDVSDIHLWNLNTTGAHGVGWGQGPSVRDYTPRIRILLSNLPTGPWTDLGVTNLRVGTGKAPDAGQLIPIGKAARYVRFAFSKPINGVNIGLAEVEFYGRK